MLLVCRLNDSHILWMTEVVRKFLSHDQHGFLVFLDYKLDLESSENLLKSIADAGLDIENSIMISSPTLDLNSEYILKDLTDELWPNCNGGLYICDSDELANFIRK